MKTINQILSVGAFCVLAALAGCENKTAFLENPKKINSHPIPYGAMYSQYAAELRARCPKLKGMNLQDIVNYLKYDLNEGKELFVGKQVNLPNYDCE